MSSVHLNGPGPDESANCCVLCLMVAKQAQWDDAKPEVDKTWRDGKPDSNVVWLPWDPKYNKLLRPGPYRGVCGDAPSLGIIGPSLPGREDGLCWDHVAGLPAAAPDMPRLDTTTQLPPGLMKGGRG